MASLVDDARAALGDDQLMTRGPWTYDADLGVVDSDPPLDNCDLVLVESGNDADGYGIANLRTIAPRLAHAVLELAPVIDGIAEECGEFMPTDPRVYALLDVWRRVRGGL